MIPSVNWIEEGGQAAAGEQVAPSASAGLQTFAPQHLKLRQGAANPRARHAAAATTKAILVPEIMVVGFYEDELLHVRLFVYKKVWVHPILLSLTQRAGPVIVVWL